MHIGVLGRSFFRGAVTSKDSALPFQDTFQFSDNSDLEEAQNFGKSALLTLHTYTNFQFVKLENCRMSMYWFSICICWCGSDLDLLLHIPTHLVCFHSLPPSNNTYT